MVIDVFSRICQKDFYYLKFIIIQNQFAVDIIFAIYCNDMDKGTLRISSFTVSISFNIQCIMRL